jgi:putative spermidine/putrescine transport system permease protein
VAIVEAGRVGLPAAAAQHRRRSYTLLLLLPAILLLASLYLIPLGQVLWLSVQKPAWSLAQYRTIVEDPINLIVLGGTFGLALEVTAICLLLGYPLAYMMTLASPRARRLLLLVIISSLWMSTLVRSYAWMVILGRQGLANNVLIALGVTERPLQLLYNRFAVYVGMVHIMLPFMVLPLFSVMQRIDLRLMNAAHSLGASRMAAFALVFFPQSLPGAIAGCLLVLILSLGFFVTPALLGGLGEITFVMLIERMLNQLGRWETAAAMSVVLLAVTTILVAIYQRVLGTDSEARAPTAPRWLVRGSLGIAAWWCRVRGPARTHRLQIPVASITGWSTVVFLVAPVTVIFPLSFSAASYLQFPPPGFSLRWYEAYFGRSDWVTPTLTSFQIAIVVAVLATVIGLLAAIPLARKQFRGKALVYGFLMSPMIVPTIVLAVAYYFFFAWMKLVGTFTAVIGAHLVLALPYVIIVIVGALRSTDESLERAAQTLGADPFRAFTRVTLPMIKPAVLTASLFAFLASFDELVVALFISGTGAKTLPKRLWEGVREEIDPTTAAVATLLTVVSLAAMALAEWLRVRSERRRGIALAPTSGGH